MKIRDIVEASDENLSFLKLLTNIFVKHYQSPEGRQQLKKIEEWHNDGHGSVFKLENPFDDYRNYKEIVDLVSETDLPRRLLKTVTDLKFQIDFDGYEFDDAGEKRTAGASFMSSTNVISFYSIDAVTFNELVSHEIRHAIQYATYEFNRQMKAYRSGKEEKTKNYLEKPIELDAYWSGSAIEILQRDGIPSSTNKTAIMNISKNIFDYFEKRMEGALSPKNKKHYWRKTVKAVYLLAVLDRAGVEMEISDVEKFIASIESSEQQMINKLTSQISKTEDPDERDKLVLKLQAAIEDKQAFMSDIPNFNPKSEPLGSIFSRNIAAPSTITVKGSLASKFSTMLYLALKGNNTVLKRYAQAVEKTTKQPIENIIYDMVEEFIIDPDNQAAVIQFLTSKLAE